MVSYMMTDSSSDSEDDLFLLAAVALSLDFKQQRQTKDEDIRIEASVIFVASSVSVDLFHFCADWRGELSTRTKIGRVLNCATSFRPPDDATRRQATSCDI